MRNRSENEDRNKAGKRIEKNWN